MAKGCLGIVGFFFGLFILAAMGTAIWQMTPAGHAQMVAQQKADAEATPTPNADATDDNRSSNDSASSDSIGRDAQPTPRPGPTKSYEQQRREDKKAFIASIDESISGNRIAGNPFKFVGDNVDLHCTVQSIPDPSWFNADCGTDDDDPAIIVVQYNDTSSLDQGQAVRVYGTVVDPMDGSNAMGGERKFPTVEAEFME